MRRASGLKGEHFRCLIPDWVRVILVRVEVRVVLPMEVVVWVMSFVMSCEARKRWNERLSWHVLLSVEAMVKEVEQVLALVELLIQASSGM